ncbi:hypothetical protein [Streptomyces sp. NBC_01174]|uniref:hypothetical protein n=1 Tax=Streptomyces sp. NBC_01174 TaxID=2903758 RepID=UPI002F906BE5|nr:hypothetical protein OG414_40975 [Streptomyces sp. NBC_01174]
MNENAQGHGYTDDEVDQATEQFLRRHLQPIAQRTGQYIGDVLDQLPEDLMSTGVYAYILANRAVARDAQIDVNAEAGTMFVALLRQLPDREDVAAALVHDLYVEIRAEEGIQD